MEKPFGTDLESARELNAELHEVFDEEQIFRIDHYLGKEAAQNILALRFANGLFEPIWNLNHIDHVQIDVPETHPVADRAGFYEETGAFRDMVVTHLFQILAFVAMEPPTSLDPDSITAREEQGLPQPAPARPDQVVRGQYEGYTGHDGVADGLGHRDPRRAALRGRQLALGRASPSTCAPASAWPRAGGSSRSPSASRRRACSPRAPGVGTYGPDHLTFDLDDSARLSLSFYGKRPGPGMLLDKQSLQFSLTEAGKAGTRSRPTSA